MPIGNPMGFADVFDCKLFVGDDVDHSRFLWFWVVGEFKYRSPIFLLCRYWDFCAPIIRRPDSLFIHKQFSYKRRKILKLPELDGKADGDHWWSWVSDLETDIPQLIRWFELSNIDLAAKNGFLYCVDICILCTYKWSIFDFVPFL